MTLCSLPSIQCKRCRVTVRGIDIDKPSRCIDARCPLNLFAVTAVAEINETSLIAAAVEQA